MKKTLLLNFFKAATSRNPRKKTTRCNGLLALFVMVMGMGVSWGQIYVNQFTGASACPTNGNTPTMATNSTGTAVSRTTITCNNTANVFSSTTLNITSSISNTSYIEFSATANSGFILNLTSISFFRQGSNSAPNQMEVRYSTDGFSTSTTWGSAPITPTTGTTATWDFTDFSTGNGGTVTFRIYPYGTTRCDLGSTASSTGTFRVDDVTINGTVTSSATPTIALSSPTQIAAGNVTQGTTSHILSNFQAAVTVANATLNAIAVVTGGTYTTNSHVSNYKLMYNATSNTFGTATQIGTTQSSVASGSTITFSSLNTAITSGNTGYFWITADISSVATDSQTINIAANPTLTFASGTPTGSISAGGAQTFLAVTPNIAISSNHPAAANINQNTNNQVFGSIALAVTTANATLNSIAITSAGTYQTSDLLASSFKLYYTTNNTFSTTTQLGSAQAIVASGNTITFSGLSQIINSGITGYLWFTADVAYNAVNGRTLSTTSTVFSNITFASGTKTGTNPVAAGNDQTIATVTPSIAIAQNGPTASNVSLSTTNAIVYSLSLAVTANTTDFNSLTVTTGGTYQTSDLVASSFKLYYTTTNSFSSATQLSTSQAIVTSGNNVVFSGINQNILIGTTGYLWVTVDIDAAAVAARTINITSTTFTNITFAAGNKTGSDPAIEGGVRTITAAPSMTELVVPQYIASKTTASNNTARITIPICLQFDNLTASTAYDIGLQLEINGTAATSFGGGNLWNGSAFSGSTLTNAFTTNSSGSSGPVWFYFQPTGNTRFDPAQNLNVRVKYITNGGSLPEDPNFIGTKTITALDIASSARTVGTSDDGAFITGTLPAQTSGKYVLLYTNETGTGNPIFVNQIITYTATNTTNLTDLPTAISNVFSQTSTSNGQFAGVVPIGANNANGIRRIEVRNADNTVFAAYSTTDGKWGSSADFTTLTRRSVGTIDYTNVNNLTLNGSITLAVATSVFGLVTVQNSATLTTGGFLTLKSNVSGTASIGSLAAGTISGSVTVERYLPARRAWRLLTAPLKGSSSNTIGANWQGTANEGLLLFSPATYQSTAMTGYTTGGSRPNIWKYDSANTQWQSIPAILTENLFSSTVNNGFLVFATGPHGSNTIASSTTAEATTLKPKGQLITGSVDHTLAANKYHLLGNPYASPLNTAGLVTSNSGTTIWMVDPTLNTFGGYFAYDGTNWTPTTPSASDAYIQSGQGFFVKNAANTTFTIAESHKVSGNSNTWFERTTTDTSVDKIRVLLYKQDNNTWQLADGILAVNSASGNHEVDAADADKMTNFNENLLFKNGTSNLAIEYRGLPAAGTLQPMQLTGTSAQPYELRIKTENYSNSNLTPYLENTQTGVLTAIPTDGSEVIVPFTGIAATSAAPDSRFRIVYQSPLSADDLNSLVVGVYPNPVQEGLFTIELANTNAPASYSLTNLLGQEVQKGTLMALTNTIPVHDLSEGVYLLQVNQEGKRFTTKLMIK